MILLKNKPDLLVAKRGPLFRFQMMNRGLVEKIFAAPTVVVHSENVEQRRFAGAGGSHHRDEFAFGDLEVDGAQHEKKLPVCEWIAAFEIFETDHKFIRRVMLGLGLPGWPVALVTRWQSARR